MKRKKVVIEEFDGLFSLYDENGYVIEQDFETETEAEEWADNNGYTVVFSL